MVAIGVARQCVQAVVWRQPALPMLAYDTVFRTLLISGAVSIASASAWQLITSSKYYTVSSRRRYANWRWLYWLQQWQLRPRP